MSGPWWPPRASCPPSPCGNPHSAPNSYTHTSQSASVGAPHASSESVAGKLLLILQNPTQGLFYEALHEFLPTPSCRRGPLSPDLCLQAQAAPSPSNRMAPSLPSGPASRMCERMKSSDASSVQLTPRCWPSCPGHSVVEAAQDCALPPPHQPDAIVPEARAWESRGQVWGQRGGAVLGGGEAGRTVFV